MHELLRLLRISIHAARVGCDVNVLLHAVHKAEISIHAARVGCDCKCKTLLKRRQKFQSTQPEWAATVLSSLPVKRYKKFQSTQPEWAATCVYMLDDGDGSISIHAARVGCDQNCCCKKMQRQHFNPRSPSGLRPIKI